MRILLRAFFLVLLFAIASFAQGPAKTTIADTLYAPDGTTVSGPISIVNPMTFTSPDGYPIPANSTINVTVTNGVFSVNLVPNIGALPPGTSYMATYQVTNATIVETWIVPQSATPVNLLAVRSLAPPLPSPMVAFEQVNPPLLCPGQVPRWSGGGWTCAPIFGATNMDLEQPDAVDSGLFQWEPQFSLTLARISCSVDTGEVDINFEVRSESAPNTPGTLVLPSSLACIPTTGVVTLFATIPSRAPVALIITNTVGSPGIVRIHSEY
jgi:hypothetical protein